MTVVPTLALPAPLEAYFAAKNVFDIGGMLACFGETASVRDEGEDLIGHAEIRAWMEKTTRKYRSTAQPTRMTQDGDVRVVAAQVSGNFPGSPIELHFRFTIAGGKIARLSIG